METKDKIIEILERCLEDKGKLPEFYADQILAEFKRTVFGRRWELGRNPDYQHDGTRRPRVPVINRDALLKALED